MPGRVYLPRYTSLSPVRPPRPSCLAHPVISLPKRFFPLIFFFSLLPSVVLVSVLSRLSPRVDGELKKKKKINCKAESLLELDGKESRWAPVPHSLRILASSRCLLPSPPSGRTLDAESPTESSTRNERAEVTVLFSPLLSLLLLRFLSNALSESSSTSIWPRNKREPLRPPISRKFDCSCARRGSSRPYDRVPARRWQHSPSTIESLVSL